MRLPLAALTAAALVLTACGTDEAGSDTGSDAAEQREPLTVLVGFYPYQFVAERVGGDDVEVTNLTAPGAEPHDLELSPQQVASLSTADLVLYSAGFQPAVDEAVEQQAADRSFDVLSAVEVREYEEHSLESDEHADEDDGHGHGEEPDEHADEDGDAAHGEEGHADHSGEDPHVWLDPTRLATIADAVAEQLAELAPDRADAFEERAGELTSELESLDAELQEGLSSCARTEMVTSHDAFGYLADRYGLEQVAISGLSPEDEPSPRRLAEVARFAQEREVTTIFFEELVSPRVAESLAREVGAEAQVLSPLEGPPEDGDYLDAMRTNLDTLRTALDCA
jgi:zinc transport system substrate-binding protein